MMPTRLARTHASLESLWLPDARERFRALLPELLLFVLAATCMSVIMSYREGASVVTLAVAAALTQIYTQGALYVCTYLMHDDPGVNIAWMLMLPGGILASEAILGFTGMASLNDGALTYACPTSILLGVALFYVTRLRGTFVLLVTELLLLADAVDETVVTEPSMLFVHIACIGATTALFVMRSSATRITILNETESPAAASTNTEERSSHALGMYGQIAALATAVGLLCLIASFAGTPAAWRLLAAGGSGSSEHIEATPTAGSDRPTAESQGEAATKPGTEAEASDETADSQPMDHATTPEPSGATRGSLPLAWLLLALLVLPVSLRLLARRLARFALGRESRATNRAARIYLGILSRLNAVGIVRDEASTPTEFLSDNEDALIELTAPAGLGIDEWMKLTDTYEKARYAGIDPTEAELETCWKLYDALPSCARKALGWRSYLTGAFWHM